MTRFRDLQESQFSQVVLDQPFWATSPGSIIEQAGAMRDLRGYTKVRLPAGVLKVLDVDPNVMMYAGLADEGILRLFEPENLVYVFKNQLEETESAPESLSEPELPEN